jgi:hypothetical protein
MEKYGFVYIWFDRKRKMYYVGCHYGTHEDGYICSSDRMRNARRRRPHDFKRRILVTGISTLEETFAIEHKWFGLIKEEELGKKYYNLRKHKWGHWSTDIDSRLTVGEKISKSRTGKKYSKRRPRTEEEKQKISAALKGKKTWNAGVTGYRVGPYNKTEYKTKGYSYEAWLEGKFK